MLQKKIKRNIFGVTMREQIHYNSIIIKFVVFVIIIKPIYYIYHNFGFITKNWVSKIKSEL